MGEGKREEGRKGRKQKRERGRRKEREWAGGRQKKVLE